MCGVLDIKESEGASGVGGTTAELLNIRGMDRASSVGGGSTDYVARKEGPSSEVNVGPTEYVYVPVDEATRAGESSDEEQTSIVAAVRTQPIGEEAHATQEQYRQAAMIREVPLEAAAAAAPPTPTDLVEVSEGDVAPTVDFSNSSREGRDIQGDRAWEAEAREGLTFDTNLASMHSYLGGLGEVDDIGSDHFNAAGGALLRLPMFYLEGIILFPGQKLPLRVLQDRFKAAVTHAMQTEGNDAPYTLGVIHVRVSRNGRIHVANYGTTAKIRQLSDQGDGSINVMTKGKQRFRIYRVMTAPDGALFAEVQIIKDDSENVTRVPRAAFSSMAPVYKRRSGRAKRAPSGLITLPNWTDGESQAASGEDYYEETEAPEQENHHISHETNRFDESNEGEEEDEVGTVDGSGDRAEDGDGDESDDFFAAVDEEDCEFSDEDEVGRPFVRQRLDASTSDGASTSVGRRLELLEPLGRQPHEGRNREGRYTSEVEYREGRNLEDSPPEEVREPLERGNTEAEAAASEQVQTLSTIPADEGIGLQQGVWANPHKKWRKDASRWGVRAQLTAWPHWVYRQYDAYDLAGRAADMLRQMGDHPRMEALVGNPISLSYYIASNMPIQDHTRQELLEIDSTLARLKREIQLLEGMDTLRCNYCHEVIARRSDIFVMSSDGAIGAYVNLHGYVHETLTLSCARGMRVEGAPQTENSWFPGYAWVLAKCRKTEQHMGWLYTAVNSKTRPAKFWGIRRTQLIGSSETQLNQD